MSLTTINNSLSSNDTDSSLKERSSLFLPSSANIETEARTNSTNNNNTSNNFTISLVQESSAIKKGVLWERQQNRIFFNRWKERFFILTTDYLTCFKRETKKVGMSEMGSFVYKINLNDIKNLTWVDKKKNGVIGVQLANTIIFLWNSTDQLLDDWMAVLRESTSQTKGRRESAIKKSATLLPTMMTSTLSEFTKTKIDLIQSDSPDLTRLVNVERGLMSEDAVPPPPPPRRYLRCLSTDLDKISIKREENSDLGLTDENVDNDEDNLSPPPLPPSRHSNNRISTISNNYHNRTGTEKMIRKTSTTSLSSCSTASNITSQSLRLKNSGLIQHRQHQKLSSPMLANNHNFTTSINIKPNGSPIQPSNKNKPIEQHQKRITAKRLSAWANQIDQLPKNFNSGFGLINQKPNTYFQSADSEFSFISTRSTTFQAKMNHNNNINESSMIQSQSPNKRNSSSYYYVNGGSRSVTPTTTTLNNNHHHMSLSSSLLMNRRNKTKDEKSLTLFSAAPPPPVPPHRTHVHHF